MTARRGEIWLANLNPIKGSEQAGTPPVLIFQNDSINKFTATFLAIPLTTNLRRANLPSCVAVSSGDGGLKENSVALCHQLRVLDKSRLLRRLGTLRSETVESVENCVMFTTGILRFE